MIDARSRQIQPFMASSTCTRAALARFDLSRSQHSRAPVLPRIRGHAGYVSAVRGRRRMFTYFGMSDSNESRMVVGARSVVASCFVAAVLSLLFGRHWLAALLLFLPGFLVLALLDRLAKRSGRYGRPG